MIQKTREEKPVFLKEETTKYELELKCHVVNTVKIIKKDEQRENMFVESD